MQKQLTGFLCLMLAAALLTGCGKQESSAVSDSSAALSESSISAVSAADTETMTDHAAFNEAVFEQVCRNIRVADSVMTVPGTLKDCGSHFSAEFVLLDEKNSILTYRLLYDGTKIGFVNYDGAAELDPKELETAEFYSVFFYPKDDGIQDITVGGVSVSDPPDKVPEVFGEPTEYELDDDGFGFRLYQLSDRHYLKYTQSDGKMYKIGICAHPD